jgi:hypothetical protein
VHVVKIYFHKVEAPIQLTFSNVADKQACLNAAQKAMANKELLALRHGLNVTGMIDASDVRAIISGA